MFKPRFDLFPYQAQGVRDLQHFGGVSLFAGDMGVGKTAQTLSWVWQEWVDASPVLIVAPANAKMVWEDEIKLWLGKRCAVLEGNYKTGKTVLPSAPVWIVNYDVLPSWSEILRKHGFRTAIVDECFPRETLVLTECGYLPIGEIVDSQLPIKVASWNTKKEKVEFKSIVRYMKNKRRSNLVRIIHQKGQLICTANHKIWTYENGFVPAETLTHNHHMRMVSSTVSSTDWEFQKSKVLLVSVFDKMESDPTRVAADIHGGAATSVPTNQYRKESPRFLNSDETTQPFQGSSYPTKNERDQRTERNPACLAGETRREWNLYDTPNHLVGSSKDRDQRQKLEDGGGDKYQSEISIPTCLQSRHRQSIEKNSGGGGREDTPNKRQNKKEGSQENSSASEIRLVCGEGVEQSNRQESQESCAVDSYVYNLEVEGNHNYFAENVLVSNCHYVKNKESKRYQALRKALGKFVGRQRDKWIPSIPHRIALSGTPITNRPSELWPTLFLLWPDVFPQPIPYFKRYCRPRWTPWGVKYDGAANLKELHERLIKLGMIRQRKKECLKNLPPKVRRIIHVDIGSKRKEYEFAKENFLLWLSRKSKDRMRSAKRAEAFTKLGYLLRFVSRAKLRITCEWISNFLESSDDKLIVFSFNRPAIDALHRHFGPKLSMKIDGSIKKQERRRNVQRFQNDPRCRLALCQGKAAGVALTLTAASDLLMHDYPWSAGDFLQIEDRIHRIGQTKTCFIHCLVAADTIEEKVIHAQRKKMKIIQRILDGDGELSAEQMFQIEQSLVTELAAEIR